MMATELIREFIDETMRLHRQYQTKHGGRFTGEFLSGIYGRILKFRQYLLTQDGSLNEEVFRKMDEDTMGDCEVFLLERIFEFARYGLVDEAVNMGRWFAEVSFQPENFLRDVGCVLAEAGRREEALRQIEENLRRFPEDVWVVINAGDAMYSLGDIKAAEGYFLRGKKMAAEAYDRLGALERLIDLSAGTGDTLKAEEYEREYRALSEPVDSVPEEILPPAAAVGTVTTGRKIGRNEPCPCGSGKKYKKCCGR